MLGPPWDKYLPDHSSLDEPSGTLVLDCKPILGKLSNLLAMYWFHGAHSVLWRTGSTCTCLHVSLTESVCPNCSLQSNETGVPFSSCVDFEGVNEFLMLANPFFFFFQKWNFGGRVKSIGHFIFKRCLPTFEGKVKYIQRSSSIHLHIFLPIVCS